MKYVTLNKEQLSKVNELMKYKAGNKVLQSVMLDNNDLLYFVAEYQQKFDTVRLYWCNAESMESKL